MYNVNNCDHECDEHNSPRSPENVFASSAPYPPVKVCERNTLYGRMMLDNMGGQNSEMSAVSLYLYNHLLIDDDDKISQIFHKISIVEMHHLQIFGQIARLMGENPRLWTHRGRQMAYWTPAYNRYPIDIKPLLLNALESEKNAVQKYQNQCMQIKDVHITACLQRIIEDEEIHIRIFKELYDTYCG